MSTATAPCLAGPLPATLAISTYRAPAAKNTRPSLLRCAWPELVELLSVHERRVNKDGTGWSPASYRPGATRANENVIEVSAFVGDLDHVGLDGYQSVRERLTELGLAYALCSTFASTPEAPRFRIVVPFTIPVPAADWPVAWQRANAHLVQGLSDPSTRDLSRMFYLPACPPDGLPFAEHHDGLALDPDKLPAATHTTAEQRNGGTSRGVVHHLGYETYRFITFGAEIGHQRGAALAATRNCLAAEHSIEETADLVWRGLQASPQGDAEKPWTHEDALKIAEDLARREPTPLSKRPGSIMQRSAPSSVNALLARAGGGHAVPFTTAAIGANGRVQGGEPAPPDGDDDVAFDTPLPRINAAELDLRIVTPQAWEALARRNRVSPTLFRHGGVPVRIEDDERGRPVLREISVDRARHELARAAEFVILRQGKKGEAPYTQIVLPPIHVVKDVLATASPPLPIINRIVECPVYAPDGTLQTTYGYHPGSQTFCALPDDLTIERVPERPTAADLDRARTVILNEQLADFPFVSSSDRANAVGLALDPYIRDLIVGPTPLRLIEAPMPGAGKGLLIETLLRPSCGRSIGMIAQARDDDEWRKRITSCLRDGYPVIQIDNLTRALESGALSMALTAPFWTDRILGQSATVRLPVRCAWTATANNPTLSTEMARRSIRIRLDPRVDKPWEREGWRHPELLSWVDDHRAELVWASLVLIQSWLSAGRPKFSGRPLGSYERWSHIIGGILEHAEIPDFLGNLSEFYDQADVESAVWRVFVASWWEKHQNTEVGTTELFPIAVETDALDLGRGNERSQKITFGKALGRQRDRIIGGYRIAQVGTRQRAAHWRLLPVNVGDVGECSVPMPYAREEDKEDNAFTGSDETFTNIPNIHPGDPPEAGEPPDSPSPVRPCAECGGPLEAGRKTTCRGCTARLAAGGPR